MRTYGSGSPDFSQPFGLCALIWPDPSPLANFEMEMVYFGMSNSRPEPLLSVPERPALNLHLVLPIVRRPGMILLVCEVAPLLSMQCDRIPRRCPICGQDNPTQG
jgi:hypothetical protein